ncbi:MAG: hypothetical protein ACSLE5_13070 [Porticoccaceae bacterium]
MTNRTARIGARYSGAPGCGNGGYIAGLLAGFIDGDAEVRINSSFPVETPLVIKDCASGGIDAWLDDRVLGSARPAVCELAVPPPPDLPTARRVSDNAVFLHATDVKGCYVCSPLRAPGDGLHLAIGALDDIAAKAIGENLVAALWSPTPDLADPAGNVAAIYVWSVLDCPGVYALKLRYPELGLLVLGSCTASIKRGLPVDQQYIVTAWQSAANDQRKLHTGVAIHSTQGELMACAKQVCFDVGKLVPRPPA